MLEFTAVVCVGEKDFEKRIREEPCAASVSELSEYAVPDGAEKYLLIPSLFMLASVAAVPQRGQNSADSSIWNPHLLQNKETTAFHLVLQTGK